MKIIETRPKEIGFVLWGHCQNLLDDPRKGQALTLYLIETPINAFANRADPDQAALRRAA